MPRLTVASLINESVRINRAAHAAIVAFRRSKPWRRTFDERHAKFTSLSHALGEAYGIAPILEFRGEENREVQGNCAWCPRQNTILLVGKLSVVTFLNCFAAARGKSRRERFSWSLSVFKKMFPLSYSRCHAVGIYLIR